MINSDRIKNLKGDQTMNDTDDRIKFGGNGAIAALFLTYHDADGWFRDPEYKGPCEAVDPDKVNQLTDAIQDLVANIVSSILDAGSERDAVNESDDLHAAIWAELHSWTAR
jgi:hypothetical protein